MPKALEAERITVRFGGLMAVNGVSLSLEEGGILGLIGPNGAGKTTLFNALTGFVKSQGQVSFEGKRVDHLQPFARTRLGMGRTFQIERPFEGLTVLENVLIPAFLHTPNRREARKLAEEVLERVELGDRFLQPSADLNLARRRRLELAKALAVKPKLLFLDELMAGLNPPALREMIAFVRSLAASGIAIIMVEHIMEAVTDLCEEVIVLASGEKIAQGTPEEVMNDERVVRAYLGAADDD